MGIETAIVTLLAPMLPALVGAGKAIGQEAANAVGEEAADLARRVWDRLKGTIAGKPTAKSAADELAVDPNDKTARDTLELQLKALLEKDSQLREDLTALIQEGDQKGVFADHGAVVYRDVSVTNGAIFIGRDARDVRQTR